MMRARSRSRWLALSGLSLTLALGIVAAVALADGAVHSSETETVTTARSPATQSPSQQTSAALPATQAVSPATAALFGVFRRPRRRSDVLPGRAAVSQHAQNGENPSLSRLAAITASGASYYLVPSRDGVCLLSENGAGSCTSLANAAQGDFTISMCAKGLAPTDMRLVGLLPDHSTDARVVFQDGSVTRVAIQQNALVIDLPRMLPPPLPIAIRHSVTIRYSVNGFPVERPLPIPPDAVGVQCAP